jgi:hypothetical protein
MSVREVLDAWFARLGTDSRGWTRLRRIWNSSGFPRLAAT